MFEKQIIDKITEFLTENIENYANRRYLLAVSGGVDSMVMTSAFREMKLSFAVAHVNFQLRGEESDEDSRFVEEYCIDHGVSIFLRKVDTNKRAEKSGSSIQMVAREIRYEWFFQLMKEENFDYLCTAHNLNDSLETVLFQLAKGTGLNGLAGIPSKTDKTIRPMSFLSREEIVAFARKTEVEWREDSSNASDKYKRNFIRHQIIPLMEEINPSLMSTFERTKRRMEEVKEFAVRQLGEIEKTLISQKEDDCYIDKGAIQKYDFEIQSVVMHYILEKYGFHYETVQEVLHGMNEQSGKIYQGKGYELLNDRDYLVLYRKNLSATKRVFTVENLPDKIKFGKIVLSLEKKGKPDDWKPDLSRQTIDLDFDKLTFPVIIRSVARGDTFQPLGMAGKKKISDFMVDRKIPVKLKPHIPLIESGGEIKAIAGYEISELAKVDNNTKWLLHIDCRNEKPL